MKNLQILFDKHDKTYLSQLKRFFRWCNNIAFQRKHYFEVFNLKKQYYYFEAHNV